MFTLSERTKNNLVNNIGLSYADICGLDNSSEVAMLQGKDCNVVFSREKKPNVVGRGNPYLSRKRFKTMKEVDESIDKIITKD